jgi:hypothetical protein
MHWLHHLQHYVMGRGCCQCCVDAAAMLTRRLLLLLRVVVLLPLLLPAGTFDVVHRTTFRDIRPDRSTPRATRTVQQQSGRLRALGETKAPLLLGLLTYPS